MTHKPEDAAIEEEIILPENLLPLGSILGEGVTPLDVSMVLAKVFRVQYAEVALLRLDGGLLKFIFPEHLRTTGAIPISSKAVAAHTALSKKAEIFNNFARVKHASIFETIKPVGAETDELAAPAPIQKLMSVPILDPEHDRAGRSADFAEGPGSEVYPGLQPRRSARSGTGSGTAGGLAGDAIQLRVRDLTGSWNDCGEPPVSIVRAYQMPTIE